MQRSDAVHYFVALLAGVVLGLFSRRLWSRPAPARVLNGLLWVTLAAVLAGMGARLGADGLFLEHGARIGLQAAALGGAALALGLSPVLGGAVAAGFGWYSLAGAMLTHQVGPGPGPMRR